MANVSGNSNVVAAFTQNNSTGLVSAQGIGYTTGQTLGDARYANGTAANQVDLLYAKQITLAASTPQTLDLSALTDAFGGAVAFARVRDFSIFNLNTTDGQIVTIGAAAANPWAAFMGTTATMPVAAGGKFHIDAPLATGLVVSGTSKNLKLDPGANSITIQIIIAGASA